MELKLEEKFDHSKLIKTIPKDKDNYTMSFDLNQEKEIKQFFDEYGFVVIKNALTKQQIEEQKNDIWDYIENENFRKQNEKKVLEVKRNDPNTWNCKNGWDKSLKIVGIVGKPSVFTRTALEIRQNEAIFKIGNLLQNTEKSLISHDRYGVFRPNKLNKIDNSWETSKNIHIDLNPWIYFGENIKKEGYIEQDDYKLWGNQYFKQKIEPDFVSEFNGTGHFSEKKVKLQGQLTIIDNKEQDGGFIVVPGMQNHMQEFAKHTQYTIGTQYKTAKDFILIFREKPAGNIVKNDDQGIMNYSQRITSKAGSLIIWNQICPHGSAPNNSKNTRMAHFFKISSQENLSAESLKIRAAIINQKVIESGCTLTDTGRKLFGLDSL